MKFIKNNKLLVASATFALVGSFLLIFASAADFVESFQAENAQLEIASAEPDSDASNDTYVQFGTIAPPPPPPPPPDPDPDPPASGLNIVYARGGGDPTVTNAWWAIAQQAFPGIQEVSRNAIPANTDVVIFSGHDSSATTPSIFDSGSYDVIDVATYQERRGHANTIPPDETRWVHWGVTRFDSGRQYISTDPSNDFGNYARLLDFGEVLERLNGEPMQWRVRNGDRTAIVFPLQTRGVDSFQIAELRRILTLL